MSYKTFICIVALSIVSMLCSCSSSSSPGVKKSDGYYHLKNGLKYKVVNKGTGKMEKRTPVTVVFFKLEGKLANQAVFANTGMIPTKSQVYAVGMEGIEKALKIMPVGATWDLVVPPELGYGNRPQPARNIKIAGVTGSGPRTIRKLAAVPPNSTLYIRLTLTKSN